MRRSLPIVAILLAMLAMPAVGTAANAYSQVLKAYERDGTIAPCAFSSTQLSSALKGVDTYGAQYFADFTDAINSALAARASGQCVSGSAQAQTSSADIGARSERPLRIGSLGAATSAGVPLPIALMALLAIAFAAVLVFAALARSQGWDPAWPAGWRHAWGEAGYRAEGAWAGFVDWLRSGR